MQGSGLGGSQFSVLCCAVIQNRGGGPNFFFNLGFLLGANFLLVQSCLVEPTPDGAHFCTTLYNVVLIQQNVYNVQPNIYIIQIFLRDSSLCNNYLRFYDIEQVLNKGVQLFTTMQKYIQNCTCCI